jgi:hypothetical protein
MRRVRTSTWILLVVFLGTLVLYAWVKPPQASTGGDTPAARQATTAPATPAPARRASRRPPRGTPSPVATPGRTPSAHRTATPHPTVSATSPTATPAPGPTPTATASP